MAISGTPESCHLYRCVPQAGTATQLSTEPEGGQSTRHWQRARDALHALAGAAATACIIIPSRIPEEMVLIGRIIGRHDNGNSLLPYGLRTVEGLYNNVVPGQERFGAADRAMPNSLVH